LTPTSLVADTLLATVIDSRLDNVSVKDAIRTLGARAGTLIVYRGDEIAKYSQLVTMSATRLPLAVALSRVLRTTNLMVVTTRDGTIVVTERAGMLDNRAAEGTIVGRVIAAESTRPIAGATVILDDAPRGVKTSQTGTFRIPRVTVGMHRVTVRLLGYAKQTKKVTVTDSGDTELLLELVPSANQLDQMVVTGTVIPTELKAVPSAITVITAKDLEQRGITRIEQLFRGDVPGVFATNQGAGSLLDQVTMFSRGTTRLAGKDAGPDDFTNPIKTYVDGVELADSRYLSQIDPRSIERIEILTGPQASTIYGSNAINGVMQIFTKRGKTATPQLSLNLLSGLVQNNFSRARTPQHDYNAQLSGLEGRISYNAGASWNYIGPWTPAKRTTVTSVFGGARFERSASRGTVTSDLSYRMSSTRNRQTGFEQQGVSEIEATGLHCCQGRVGNFAEQSQSGQTLGLTVGYAPTAWWSHEFGVGQDIANGGYQYTSRAYQWPGDTTLFLAENRLSRQSLHYSTTMRIPLTSLVQATVTAGSDAWQELSTSTNVFPQKLTGTLTLDGASFDFTRLSSHNTGAFLQTQVGVSDQLFFTYGVRAEWNPNFGAEAEPNYAGRYGVAYTTAVGIITTKLRASYGRSTRPPTLNQKNAAPAAPYGDEVVYGHYNSRLANPLLAPEYQKGSELGLELYIGARTSLIVTHYNETVDDLVTEVRGVDSVRSLLPNPRFGFFRNHDCTWVIQLLKDPSLCSSQDAAGYTYAHVSRNLNISGIRNQGWELQGSVSTGPLTTRGTYSWTQSRSLGANPTYRRFFTPISLYPQYQPGATFQYLPEHTWAVGLTYAQARTTVALNVTGTGKATNLRDEFYFKSLDPAMRLQQDLANATTAYSYVTFNSGYSMVDINASHRFSERIESVLQVHNLTNKYVNDVYWGLATIGRQTKAGMRLRL